MVNMMNARLRREKIVLFLLCVIASFFCSAANDPAPRASVDRTIVNEGDSITLTIRVNSSSNSEPDFTALQKDFEIYNSGSSSQTGLSNGKFYSLTEWQTTLIPKHSGQLQIPPLSIAGSQTQPITIQVNARKQSNADGSEPIFVEVETERKDVYVNQQILLTARLYVDNQIAGRLKGDLTKPAFDNATVEQLPDTTSTVTINQTLYQVVERKYAIFPQKPGDLTIPELVFNAIVDSAPRSLFDFPGRGRPLRAISKQLSVYVKPIPQSFTGTVWLPARNLTLTETWSGDQQHLAVGDSITRSIAIRADGLLAMHLPKLEQSQLNSAKLYADQPKLENPTDATGVHGKRIENIALIPTQAGQLQLPETRVIWWDIDSDSEKVATLSAETLTIAAGANAASAPPPLPQPATSPQSSNTTVQSNEAAPAAASTNIGTTKTTLWWQIATAALALLWLLTLFAYLQLRRSRTTAIDNGVNIDDRDEKAAWRNFSDACRANNSAAARQQLLRWATLFYRDENVRTVEQLQHVASNPQLLRELQLLDNRLFGTLLDSSDWNGENLLAVVQEMKKHAARKNRPSNNALPPLYPAA